MSNRSLTVDTGKIIDCQFVCTQVLLNLILREISKIYLAKPVKERAGILCQLVELLFGHDENIVIKGGA